MEPIEAIQLATPDHFKSTELGGQLEKIGFHNQFLFVGFRAGEQFEIWRVHCLTPASWTKLYELKCKLLFYVYFTLDNLVENCIWVLLLAQREGEGFTRVSVVKVDQITGGILSTYQLNPDYEPVIEGISLERVKLGHAGKRKNTLYLIDRSMVMGTIPFYHINIDDETETFTVESKPLLSDESAPKCTRFPVVIDGSKRQILKLTNENGILLYDEDEDLWKELVPAMDTDLNLFAFGARGISETYGQNWHRFGAVESPLSVLASDDCCCIFKLFQGGKHTFFKFSFSKEEGTYRLQRCASAKLGKRLEVMFYMHCTDDRVAFVNKHLIGFVDIHPPSLRAICYWRLQRIFAEKDSNGVWREGKTEQEICNTFGLNRKLRLV
ncbi:hypothetical protein Ddc_02635 [Ditylenchus destructor]|nr:hypothetical protein Ddc_02635 [Ditylenchus destructor]